MKNHSGQKFRDTFFFYIFFSIWVFLHEHSQITGQQEKGQTNSLAPFNHFHTLYRLLDISRAITAWSSPLGIYLNRKPLVSKLKSLTTKLSTPPPPPAPTHLHRITFNGQNDTLWAQTLWGKVFQDYINFSFIRLEISAVFLSVSLPHNIYLFEDNYENTRKIYETCSKFTIETPERRQ